MNASFYILTSDGVAIVEARDGYLWTQAASVGWTRLPDAALEAVLACVPATRFDDLAPLVKRYAKAVKKLGADATTEQLTREVNGLAPVSKARPEHVTRQPSEAEEHVRNGCRKVRCKVCG
jgi:hypothetical protein